jgi:hypothetical protein
MGGSSFYYSVFTTSSLTSLENANVDVNVAASLDFFVHAGADVSKDAHFHDWQMCVRIGC